MEIKNYYKAKTLEDAYQKLNEHSSNIIAGGGAWLKMSTSDHETMVDLSGLSLNQIDERKNSIEIGKTSYAFNHQLINGIFITDFLGVNVIALGKTSKIANASVYDLWLA